MQVVASALAAASAALAATYLGVIGTVIGAALIGGTATIGTVVYERSLHRTNVALRWAARRSAQRFEGIVATLPEKLLSPKVPPRPAVTTPSIPRTDDSVPTAITTDGSLFPGATQVIAPPTSQTASWGRRPQRRLVATVAAVTFATAMVTVIGVQLLGGASLSEAMSGDRDNDPARERSVIVERPTVVAPTVTSIAPEPPTVTTTVNPTPSEPSSPQPPSGDSESDSPPPTGATPRPSGSATATPEPSLSAQRESPAG